MANQLSKPLPCPFCGELPEVGPKNPAHNGSGWGFVTCVNPRCPATLKVSNHGLAVSPGPDGFKEAAILKWNKRMQMTFYFLEELLIDHCGGVMRAEFSTLANGNIYITLGDENGELVTAEGESITQAIVELEKQAQMFAEDYH